MDKILT